MLAGYRPRLVAVAIAIGLDRVQAEDVVHDVLIRVARSATELADDELAIYAAKAVRNLAANVLRDTARRARIVEHAALRPDYERFEGRVLTRMMASDHLASMAETERAETVEMFLLWTVGYTHGEIAEMYGITEPAVQSRLHRAAKKRRNSIA